MLARCFTNIPERRSPKEIGQTGRVSSGFNRIAFPESLPLKPKRKVSGATESKRFKWVKRGAPREAHFLRRSHMSIRQEVIFPVSPERVYELLTSSEEFARATGKPAKIEAVEGAAFSIFGGYIQGRQIELVPGQRIVQAWRGSDWDAGVYSFVRFTLTPEGKGARLVVDHDAYPQGK